MKFTYCFHVLQRWGLARHFHYVPEILGAFFWTVPALFDHVSFYSYVFMILLRISY